MFFYQERLFFKVSPDFVYKKTGERIDILEKKR